MEKEQIRVQVVSAGGKVSSQHEHFWQSTAEVSTDGQRGTTARFVSAGFTPEPAWAVCRERSQLRGMGLVLHPGFAGVLTGPLWKFSRIS